MCNHNKPAEQKFCSQNRARKSKRKVNWDQIDLLTMLEQYGIKEVDALDMKRWHGDKCRNG